MLQGADGGGSAYKRAPASHEGPAAFLFEGVTAEVIGATGFDMGAAASDEVDRFDLANGSPPWGIVIASAQELSRYYKLVVEELQISRENIGGDHEPGVRADLVLLEHEAGGFVFSVGSIGWIQSMAVGYFDSDTARVTENALCRAIQIMRQNKSIVIVISHRPSALAALNMAMVLYKGNAIAFGSCAEIFSRVGGPAAPPAAQPIPDVKTARRAAAMEGAQP